MYSNKKNNNTRRTDNEKKQKKSVGFHLDMLKNRFIQMFSGSSKKEVNRRTTKKIYDIVPDEKSKLARKRERYQRPLQRRVSEVSKRKEPSILNVWFKKTALIIGKVKISRLGLTCTVFVLLALASGSFALASSFKDNRQIVASGAMMVQEESSTAQEKKVILTYDNKKTEILTKSTTVSEVLKENNITLSKTDKITPALDDTVIDNMQIDVVNEFPVKIIFKGEQEQTINMTKGTVATALKEAGINYDDDDRIIPEPYTKLYNGIEIKCDKIEIKKITEEQEIEYETETGETSTVATGMYAITQKGRNGKKECTIAITYINGIEDRREILEENIIKEPVTKIVLNGTGKRKSNSTDENSDGDSDGDDYDDIKITNPGEQVTNPSIPAGPGSYVKKQVAHVTAYTHTGSTTATGTWPRSTRTRENPGSCAVVPSTFPYGTLFYVPGYGYCIAEDTGGFRHDPDRKYQIDLFMNTKDECRKWGRRRSWEVYVLRIGYP